MHRRWSWMIAIALAVTWSSTARAESLDTIPLWSLMLEVRTCDISNAGSDDSVSITIGERTFVLNKGGSERNRGNIDWYELVAAISPARAAPIDALTGADLLANPVLSKSGSDMWCISEINLFANGTFTPFYHWEGQLRLDNTSGLSTRFELPSIVTGGPGGGGWASSSYGTADSIPGMREVPESLGPAFLQRYFDSTQGHLNWAEGAGPTALEGWYTFDDNRDSLRWGNVDGPDHVQLDGASQAELHVDFDFEYWVSGANIHWRETDGDIRIAFTCGPDGVYRVSTAAADCDVRAAGNHYSSECSNALLRPMSNFHADVLRRVLASVRSLGRSCGTVSITTAGEIRLF